MTTKRSIREARTLIDAGDGEFIAKSLDSFDEADQLEIVLALIADGDGYHVAQIVNALDYGVIIAALTAGFCFAGTIYEQEELENLREAFAFDCEQFVRDSAEAKVYTAALRRLDNAMRDRSQLDVFDDPTEAIERSTAAQHQADDAARDLRASLEAMNFPFCEYESEFWPDRDDVRDYDDLLAGFRLTPITARKMWVEAAGGWTLRGDAFLAEIYSWAGDGFQWRINEGDGPWLRSDYPSGEGVDTCMRDAEVCIAIRELR